MCDACRQRIGDDNYERIEAFLGEYPGAEYGPAHIVLSDFNCESNQIAWCLGLISGELARRGLPIPSPSTRSEMRGMTDLKNGALGGQPDFYKDCDLEELQATQQFLRDVLLPKMVVR